MDAREIYLLQYTDDYCDLVRDDNIEIVNDLLMYELVSAFFHDIEDEYTTPVVIATYDVSLNCLELLCEYGATSCVSCNKKKPFLDPLITATMGNQIELVWILLVVGSGGNLLWKGFCDLLPDIMICLVLRK